MGTERLLPPTRLRRITERLPKLSRPKRFWMHVPWGLVTAACLLFHPVVPFLPALVFLAYEYLESDEIGDHSYLDIEGMAAGTLAGLAMVGAGLTAWYFIAGGVWWWMQG